MLVGQAEQMALVVLFETTVGAHEDEAIEVRTVGLDDQAAADGAVRPFRDVGEPLHRRTVHRFGLGARVHRETGREHLRQDDHIGRAIDAVDQGGECVAIRGRVVPMQILLDQSQV